MSQFLEAFYSELVRCTCRPTQKSVSKKKYTFSAQSRPPVSRQIAGKKPPPLPPPQSESSDDDDYGDEFGGDDDSASYGSSRGDQQVEEEGIVEDVSLFQILAR